MKKWGFYSIALVGIGCAGVFLLQDKIFVQPHSELALNAPALSTKAQTNGSQQSDLDEKFNALSVRLDQLATRLGQLTTDSNPQGKLPVHEQAQLKQTVIALTKRLERLEAQLDSTEESALFETTAIEEQSEDPESHRLLEQASLEEGFSTQPRDSDWAAMMEDELSELLLTDAQTQDGLIDYECRSTSCRATVEFDSLALRNQSLETLPALLEGVVGEVSVIPVEGTTEVEIFVR